MLLATYIQNNSPVEVSKVVTTTPDLQGYLFETGHIMWVSRHSKAVHDRREIRFSVVLEGPEGSSTSDDDVYEVDVAILVRYFSLIENYARAQGQESRFRYRRIVYSYPLSFDASATLSSSTGTPKGVRT